MKYDQEISKYYYTAAQARKALGIDEQAFQYWIRKGRINKTILPGRTQGMYSIREVNEIINEVESALIAAKLGGYEYRKATVDDLEEGYELAYLIFGKGAYPLEVREKFMERNADIFYHLYDDKKLVALFNIIPFKHEAVQRFIHGEVRIKDIDSDDLELFVPGKPLECIIVEMITTPMVPPEKRSNYGARLLGHFTRTAYEWGTQGVEIAKLYGTSSTPTGLHILQTAEFQQIDTLPLGRHAFELDVEKSDVKILKGYKDALRQWKEGRRSAANINALRTVKSRRPRGNTKDQQ